MPCYNSGIHLIPAIESILNNTKYPFELLLIESESTDGTDNICDYYANKYNNIRVIHTKREGLVKAYNTGIKNCEGDVYLTQDDVILPKLYGRDWLTEIVKVSKSIDCGLITTLGGWGISGEDYIKGLKWVGTWSVFIPRKTIEKIGLYDELFSPGMGDDIDYSFRIYRAGLKIFMMDFWVDHHRRTEHRAGNNKTMIEHAKLFRKKWKIGEFNDG